MSLTSVEQMVGLEPGSELDRAPVRLPRRDLSGLRKAELFLAQVAEMSEREPVTLKRLLS